jgi:hypothetical protein
MTYGSLKSLLGKAWQRIRFSRARNGAVSIWYSQHQTRAGFRGWCSLSASLYRGTPCTQNVKGSYNSALNAVSAITYLRRVHSNTLTSQIKHYWRGFISKPTSPRYRFSTSVTGSRPYTASRICSKMSSQWEINTKRNLAWMYGPSSSVYTFVHLTLQTQASSE